MKTITTTPRRWHIVLNPDGTKIHSQPVAIEFSQGDLSKMLKGFKVAKNYRGYGTADEFEPSVDNWKSFIALFEEKMASKGSLVTIEFPTQHVLPDIHDFVEALNWAAGALGLNAAPGGVFDLKLCCFLEDVYFEVLDIEEKLGLL